MSSYFVVPFTYKDVQENRDLNFNLEIELALVRSDQELRKDPRRKREALEAEVRFYRRTASSPGIAAYDRYSEVLFLNEAAMRICRDRGIAVNVLNIMAEEELPDGLGIQCRKPYLPTISGGE